MKKKSTNKPKIAVILLNWNGKKFIDTFMSSLMEQTYPHGLLKLVFVDNNSSDDSLEYFKVKYSKKINTEIVINKRNYGYSRGNNEGLKCIGSAEYALICNNDIILEKECIDELVNTAIRFNADVTSSKLMFLNKPGTINNAGSILDENSNWPVRDLGIYEKDSKKYKSDYEISAFCGACVLVRKDFFSEVGLFDKKFFMYFEDGDLSWRGRRLHKHYYFSSKAIALHYHSGTSKEGSPLFNYYVGRNRLLILTKNASIRVLLSGWRVMIRENFLMKIKNLIKALYGEGSFRVALMSLFFGIKVITSALILTPYAILKRYMIIKEDYL